MKTRHLATLAAVALISLAGPALSDQGSFVAGQKIDSGLGELPHYSKWADPSGRHPVRVQVEGESLDSGLGDLPHYSTWTDRTGKNPLGRPAVLLSQAPR